MNRLLVFALVACGTPRRPPPAPPTNTAAAVSPASSVDNITDLARRIGSAAIRGDRDTTLASTLTYEQVTALSTRAAERTKEQWQDEVERFLAEARDDQRHPKVVDATIVGTGTLTPAKDGVTRAIEFAFVKVVIEVDCPGCSMPRLRESPRVFMRMPFLKTAEGWRFAVHQ